MEYLAVTNDWEEASRLQIFPTTAFKNYVAINPSCGVVGGSAKRNLTLPVHAGRQPPSQVRHLRLADVDMSRACQAPAVPASPESHTFKTTPEAAAPKLAKCQCLRDGIKPRKG